MSGHQCRHRNMWHGNIFLKVRKRCYKGPVNLPSYVSMWEFIRAMMWACFYYSFLYPSNSALNYVDKDGPELLILLPSPPSARITDTMHGHSCKQKYVDWIISFPFSRCCWS